MPPCTPARTTATSPSPKRFSDEHPLGRGSAAQALLLPLCKPRNFAGPECTCGGHRANPNMRHGGDDQLLLAAD